MKFVALTPLSNEDRTVYVNAEPVTRFQAYGERGTLIFFAVAEADKIDRVAVSEMPKQVLQAFVMGG
jgi:hypothetical protein